MPIATTLRTPWTPGSTPLPEYPRPALIRPGWVNLNGEWEHAVRPSAGALHAVTPPAAFDGAITVPFAVETVLSGVTRALEPHETLFYRRHISIPGEWVGSRVALNIEAADYECVVLADGAPIGTHTGGYLPFSVELPQGRPEIDLVIAVRDPGPEGRQQYGKQSRSPGGIWYTATSGIWGTVWMEPLPDTAITAVSATTPPSLDALEVTVTTEVPAGVEIRVELPDGGQVTATGRSGGPVRLTIPDPRPWSPDDPHLYPLTVSTAHDEVTSYAGLRTVGIGPIPGAPADERPAILLNGTPLFLNAPLDQGYWPESGLTAPADEALLFDLTSMRDLGFNGVRKHIKVESRRFYHHADRLGMLVLQDAVNGGRPWTGMLASTAAQATDVHLRDTTWLARRAAGRDDADNRAEFERDLAGMISLLQPHPSIIGWVPFNESWGQFDARRIEILVRGLDPTRLVDTVSGWYDQWAGDFRSRHRYVLPLQRPPKRDRRPYFVSEFGGYNLAGEGHLWEGAGRFGYRFHDDGPALDAALAQLWREQLIPLVTDGLRAAVYTQVSDVEIETNGLFTYDRQVCKVDADLLRTLNAELYAAFDGLCP